MTRKPPSGLAKLFAKNPTFKLTTRCLGCGEKCPTGMCDECRKVMPTPGTSDEERARGPGAIMAGLDAPWKRVAAAFVVPALMQHVGARVVHVNGVPFTRNEMQANLARVMLDEYGKPKKPDKP